jgi:hypothetical protein
MEGSIFLHRQLLESSVFASEKRLKIWIWLLIKASYKSRFVNLKIGNGESIIELKRGELLFGRFTAEEQLSIDGSTIYKIIHWMESEGMIKIQSNNHFTIITICNYNTYQQINYNEVTTSEQPGNNRVTTGEQQANTNKKDNKVKKVKEINNIPEISEIVNFCLAGNFFESKYMTVEAKKTISNLLTIDKYTVEQIKNSIKFAKTDQFWAANFLSLNKLRSKNKEGVKYIDVFLAKLNQPQKSVIKTTLVPM